MTIEHLTIPSKLDQLPLAVTITVPEHPVGIIQFVHGMAEYRTRYFKTMEYFTKHGYVTIIHDHRGHGNSILNEQDLGYFYHTKAKGLVEDTHQITTFIKTRFPGLPCFLLGHSMGSLVARCYLQQYDKDLTGLILTGAPNENKKASLGIVVCQFLSLFLGSHHRSKLVNAIAFHGSNQKFKQEGDPNSWICSDPLVRESYQKDPLCGFTFTLDGFHGLFDLMKTCFQPKLYQKQKLSLPILILVGEDDPVAGGKEGLQQSVEFLKKVGYQIVDSNLYRGKRHELLNETNQEDVKADILKWIGG